jgi:ferrous iron transport protein B
MECHAEGAAQADVRPVILIGNPNVGKSAVFAALTGRYVAVSNYPGTTVEVATGTLSLDGGKRQVIDTPGVRSLVAGSDDERVARDIVLTADDASLVQVADAKDLRRALLLTLELTDAGVSFALDLNMADEAHLRGISIDDERLSSILGVPVVSTVATRREGIDALGRALDETRPARIRGTFDPAIERAIADIEPLMPAAGVLPRALALMLLADGSDLAERVGLSAPARAAVDRSRTDAEREVGRLAYALNRTRLAEADRIVGQVVRSTPTRPPIAERIGALAADRVWGWPILAAVLLVVYLFVGRLGAGTMVGWLEKDLFGRVVNPSARRLAAAIPVDLVVRFLVGRYGLITMALTYGLAIVLPIVATFFLAFGVLEDSGYLPRLAVVLDRACRRIGLNGKAVLPMVLGLGCVTMATMTTRILETRKERLQVTLLLALSVPCSAQLGVILGMIGSTGAVGVAIWGSIIVGSLLGVGWLAARIIPGETADFVLELPPIRVPGLGNIARKTWARLMWYLREVIPVFVIGTAVLFVLDEIGVLRVLESWLSPVVVGWLGLPTAATAVLIVGFLRRDYGAAGMFALAAAGALTPAQVLVSLVVISLFVPCIASVLMIAKEYGTRIAAGMTVFTLAFALGAGAAVHYALEAFGVTVG